GARGAAAVRGAAGGGARPVVRAAGAEPAVRAAADRGAGGAGGAVGLRGGRPGGAPQGRVRSRPVSPAVFGCPAPRSLRAAPAPRPWPVSQPGDRLKSPAGWLDRWSLGSARVPHLPPTKTLRKLRVSAGTPQLGPPSATVSLCVERRACDTHSLRLAGRYFT